MSTTHAFARAAATLANLNALLALAESTFAATDKVIAVHTYAHNCTVSVQMKEADLLAWCEAHGLTPSPTVAETDYTMYGGGFTTHRRTEVVVEVGSELGLLLLTSSEVVSTRPAVPATEEAVA